MHNRARAASLVAALLALHVISTGFDAPAEADAAVFPAAKWQSVSDPGALGATPARLEDLRGVLRAGQTTGMLVIVGGRILFEYGDVAEVSYIASARKSLVSMLYGNYVTNGTIRLQSNLRALGVDDTGGLLPKELDATVQDLLEARSGVYHPAANLGDASALAPLAHQRGEVGRERRGRRGRW